jgi:preprotein translocase subunit YajC
MTPILPLLAQAKQPTQAPGGLLGSPFIMMGLMVVMFYFLLIRPQQRQRKEQAARIAALQAGDKVVTTAGIHGIVHNVKEHTVVVKVAEGTMVEFDKPAIAVVHKKDAGN